MNEKDLGEALGAVFKLFWGVVCLAADVWAILVLWPHPAGVTLFVCTTACVAAIVGGTAYDLKKDAGSSVTGQSGGEA